MPHEVYESRSLFLRNRVFLSMYAQLAIRTSSKVLPTFVHFAQKGGKEGTVVLSSCFALALEQDARIKANGGEASMLDMLMRWEVRSSGDRREGSVMVAPDCGPVRVRVEFQAGILEHVEANLSWSVAEGEKIFLNGYQSWTHCPELKPYERLLGAAGVPEFMLNLHAFDRYGDYHFVKYGKKPGQSHGFTYGYFRLGKRFRLVASLDEDFGYTIIRYNAEKGVLSFERDCEGLGHGGGELRAFDLFFAEGTEDEVFDA